jgi:hypothetical protein
VLTLWLAVAEVVEVRPLSCSAPAAAPDRWGAATPMRSNRVERTKTTMSNRPFSLNYT